jgi:hypothetical protein
LFINLSICNYYLVVFLCILLSLVEDPLIFTDSYLKPFFLVSIS